MPIYDAKVTVLLGGDGYEVEQRGTDIVCVHQERECDGTLRPFVVECGDTDTHAQMEEGPAAAANAVQTRHAWLLEHAPKMQLPGFPHVGEFVATVPALLESCVIKHLGIPRATPGRYYWIWAWDAMVTALSSLRWHDSTVAESTACFVNAHRDLGGLIPMRWTRALEPLDTQPRGSLESLLTSLIYEICRERRDTLLLEEIYPAMRDHLTAVREICNAQGMFGNSGFYPDLPLAFGRNDASAVAMEIGNFYVFCRTCENAAIVMGDEGTRQTTVGMAALIERYFVEQFWDYEKGFLIDSVDLTSGERNASYPLFTLLFLHSSLGWPLIRSRLAECAEFLLRHHCSPLGMRLLPAWDKNAQSETATGSWYPHWDLYALKILRRAGFADTIVSWLKNMNTVLEKLGYAPEFLIMDGLSVDDSTSWLRHGAASNLNCVTGWYQALLESIFGLERDPGGLTVVPLALPLGTISLSGMHCMGTLWNVTVNNSGSGRCSLRVDGQELRGSMKVPSRYHDGGVHTLAISYDAPSPAREFLELMNAELAAIECTEQAVKAVIRALGSVEIVFSAPPPAHFILDGTELLNIELLSNGTYAVRLQISGEHTVHI
jgi:hypothetical protein